MDNLGDESVYDTNELYSPQVVNLASKITSKLDKLSPYNKQSSKISIFRVPEKYRNKNKEAYTPRLVSIGLIHHDESHLKPMEIHKLEYLNHFLITFRFPLERLVEFVQVNEKAVCGSYDDIYSRKLEALDPKVEPSEVILLDGIFVVVLLLKNRYREMRENGDVIFDNPWVASDILRDMMLIENQLPLWFLSSLYDTFIQLPLDVIEEGSVAPPSFMELVLLFFRQVGDTRHLSLTPVLYSTKNLVEFLLTLHHPPLSGNKFRQVETRFLKLDLAKSQSATHLTAQGVSFQSHYETTCFLDVCFDRSKGELRIPTLVVNDLTETFFHNLIAIEQVMYRGKYITSYIILMGSLINSHKDVDLLIKFGIIKNQYGSSAKLAKLFSDLYTELVLDAKEFYFADLCVDINQYSRGLWYTWKALVTKTPLIQAISIATVIGTVLGVIQTVCSVLQVTSAK